MLTTIENLEVTATNFPGDKDDLIRTVEETEASLHANGTTIVRNVSLPL